MTSKRTMKTYSYAKDKSVKISQHFAVSEFRSHAGATLTTDKIIVCAELVQYLEYMYSVMECSKAIISSGYRDAACDKAVGGSGSGPHVDGKAVDICFYGADGKVIPSWKVCCIAQDIGFNGAAKINDNYTHLDVCARSLPYRGDESKCGTSSVPGRDFYKYFGKTQKQVYTMMRPHVSVWSISGDKIRVGSSSYIWLSDLRGDTI